MLRTALLTLGDLTDFYPTVDCLNNTDFTLSLKPARDKVLTSIFVDPSSPYPTDRELPEVVKLAPTSWMLQTIASFESAGVLCTVVNMNERWRIFWGIAGTISFELASSVICWLAH
ncbi:hypothetical protein NM688_g3611 [Phlebia brevispora]|uniref:Uncharacterized protein n=1 Tax=Phlebia brevispora TaxID=194682 RepID=A0ACC1T5N5_9APHY|nr:hypothetical protein NM688_g3611 [Phlebia brevispora]